MKRAVIFDLDGTLVNSIPVHMNKDIEIFGKIGIKLTPKYFYEKCNGKKSGEFYRVICKDNGITDEKKIQALIKKGSRSNNLHFMHGIKTFPHVKTLLKQLKKDGYKLAIASSSGRNYVEHVTKYNNIDQYFDVFVSGTDTELSKPNPAIFLLARKQLGIKKSECIIVEDALNGFKAAKRAGIDCLGVLTSLKRSQIPDYVQVVSEHKKLSNVIKKL